MEPPLRGLWREGILSGFVDPDEWRPAGVAPQRRYAREASAGILLSVMAGLVHAAV